MAVRTEKSRYVIGLDFGTTFSGIACAARSDENKIIYEENWDSQAELVGSAYCKTITASLYKNGKLEAWGWPSVLKYNKAVEAHKIAQIKDGTLSSAKDVDMGGLELLERFKLVLAPPGSNKTPIALPAGLTAEKVVTDYLEQIGAAGLALLRRNFGEFIQPDHVQWCLTVPAMWSDGAKQMMKTCAQAAGLVRGGAAGGRGSPFPLVIVLEPEAASLYCQKKLADLSVADGAPYLVVDAGGGTVDLVVHEKAGGELKEVTEGSGGTCGGSYVDDNFVKFMAAKFPFFANWAAVHRTGFNELKREWHMQKKVFKGARDDEIALRLPLSLADAARAHKVEGNLEYVIMTGAEMAAVFDPVVEDVLALIRAQLDAVAAKGRVCETLLLVGGFAESNYLHDRIRAEFQAKIPVIKRPINPGSAIIQGAVTFGFNPRLIMNRKARKTYGIGTTEEFVEGFHDPKKKIYVCGRAFCDDRFLKFVIHGQDVKIDDVVEHTVCPLRPDQKAVTVTLYSTEDSDPMYVTEDGMHKESSIDLDIGKSTHGTESTILVSLSFGVTSIEVKAKGANFAAEETSCSITGHYEQQ